MLKIPECPYNEELFKDALDWARGLLRGMTTGNGFKMRDIKSNDEIKKK